MQATVLIFHLLIEKSTTKKSKLLYDLLVELHSENLFAAKDVVGLVDINNTTQVNKKETTERMIIMRMMRIMYLSFLSFR